MEYDRVFASMAIPACCWRRQGKIFRGNNEMAQLIDVPIEGLRDVSIYLELVSLPTSYLANVYFIRASLLFTKSLLRTSW